MKFINENTIQVSKMFAKNAMIYGTDEYKLWRKCLSENPGVVMITKTIKKNPNKETNKNLTYENMRLYISVQENAEALLAEFERELIISKIQTNPYRAVLGWFLQEFKDYDSYKKFFKDLEKQKESETKDVNIEKMPSVVNE